MLQIVSVAVVVYDNIDDLLPTRMNVETFYDPEATTSADNPENAVDPEKIAKATINSRIVSITVDPPITPPLDECITITMEHKTRNNGKLLKKQKIFTRYIYIYKYTLYADYIILNGCFP